MSPRYLLRLISAFFSRFKAILLVSVMLGVVVFLFLTLLLPELSSTKTKIGKVGRYTVENLPDDISTKISSGLTKIDDSGSVLPNIAKSWETTDGGKTWTFKLDENSKWQDGKKVSTSDLKYEFRDAEAKIVDDSTIQFNLDSPFSAFPVILSKPVYKKGLLGVGSWKVKDMSLIGGYIQNITIIDDKKNKITYKFYPTEERLSLGFKLGEIDVIGDIQDYSEFKNWRTVSITENTSYSNFVVIFLNTESEKFQEKSVRQALNYAIRKDRYANRAIGPLSPFSWAYNPQVKPYEYDKNKLEDLKDITIKISTLSNLLKQAEIVASDWNEAGIKTEVETVTSVPENYEAFMATVDIPKDPDQYSLWHSTQQQTNISKFKNARIDKLLEDGRTEIDQEIRKKIYLDFQRFLVEEVPAIFLYHPTFYDVARK